MIPQNYILKILVLMVIIFLYRIPTFAYHLGCGVYYPIYVIGFQHLTILANSIRSPTLWIVLHRILNQNILLFMKSWCFIGVVTWLNLNTARIIYSIFPLFLSPWPSMRNNLMLPLLHASLHSIFHNKSMNLHQWPNPKSIVLLQVLMIMLRNISWGCQFVVSMQMIITVIFLIPSSVIQYPYTWINFNLQFMLPNLPISILSLQSSCPISGKLIMKSQARYWIRIHSSIVNDLIMIYLSNYQPMIVCYIIDISEPVLSWWFFCYK